jgi:ATP-dependent Clp protease, protease subunit
MKPQRLLNLFSANAKRGSFRADASSNTIELYDYICSSEDEAAWFGGVSLHGFANALGQMSGQVHLRINSPGGDVFAGIAMAQLMRDYKGEIVAHVDGYAASAASIVAIAAKQVLMAPASMLMIHKAWTFAMGNSDDLLATASLLEKIDGQLADTYAQRGKKSADEFLDLMSKETWFTPQEAIDAGLCDGMAQESETKSNRARAIWDLSAFDRAPAPPAEPVDNETDPAAAAAAAAAKNVATIAAAESEHEKRRRLLQLLDATA